MMRKSRKWLVLLVIVGAVAVLSMRHEIRRLIFIYHSPAEVGLAAAPLRGQAPTAATGGASDSVPVLMLEKVASGFVRPTDVQFVPGSSDRMVVLEQGGAVRWMRLSVGKLGLLLSVRVLDESEQGLLGLAFHPEFLDNGRFYINYVRGDGGRRMTRIAEWTHTAPADFASGTASETRVVLELEQPHDTHNGGQIRFGPDGYLYVGFGDGGPREDPHGHGQNPATLLGSIVRIDVDHPADGRGYSIPKDNPFIGKGRAPELWAIGLRNPWRFSFAPDGRLVVADVGQDVWEEIDIVRGGDNLGWSVREAHTCFNQHADCQQSFVEPIHAYNHEVGSSITGGFVYTGTRMTALRGRYIFADFTTGRFFALSLPSDRAVVAGVPGGVPARELGRWPLLPVSFGRDAAGEIYVATFGKGDVYRLASDDAGAKEAAGRAPRR